MAKPSRRCEVLFASHDRNSRAWEAFAYLHPCGWCGKTCDIRSVIRSGVPVCGPCHYDRSHPHEKKEESLSTLSIFPMAPIPILTMPGTGLFGATR